VAAGCGGGEPVPPPVRSPLAVAGAGTDGASLPAERSLAGRGARLYARWCADCHGATADGRGPAGRLLRPPPTGFLEGEYMRRQRPAWYYEALTRGVSGTAMGRWDHVLDAGDRWDVAFYVWSLVDDEERLKRGRAVYQAACSECHGPDGNAEPGAPLAVARQAGRTRLELAELVVGAHPAGDVELGPGAVEDVVAHLFTWLYEPVGWAAVVEPSSPPRERRR